MRKLLGLDIGDKRVGTALVGPDQSFSIPHKTFLRENGVAEREILAIVAERGIEAIVVGMPLNEDGTKSEQCLKVENFCRRLKKRADIDVLFVDEYGTSSEAEAALRSTGVSGKRAKKKGATDAVAAALILQLFLESQKDQG